jgi:putative chitinase
MTTQGNSELLLARAMEAGITDPRELAIFMGQMEVESGGFSRLSENLNYSGKRLLQVFGKRTGADTLVEANALAERGPEAIANAVYGGEWGKRLGNTEQGDGWRFRGRGFVQITGRSNYEHFGRALGIDLVSNPALAATPEIGAAIAVQYWSEKVVRHGFQHDVQLATKGINGGHNGLHQREAAADRWLGRLQEDLPRLATSSVHATTIHSLPTAEEAKTHRVTTGMHGPAVQDLQATLNHLGYRDGRGRRLRVDGHFGDNTADALCAFQKAHGLPPVGHVGPRTRAALEISVGTASPMDPAHPDHALQQQVSRAVDAMERSLGRDPDGNSERLKASLLLTAKQNGLVHVDHVVLSEARGPVQAGQHVFAVQGRLDDPASRRVHVATQQALATPIQASWARLAEVDAMERVQPRNTYAHVLAARHGEHGDGMRRTPSP